MPRQQGLLRRGSRYYTNIKVPKDLQEALGKELIREAIGTSDYGEARRKVAFEVARWTAHFEEQRRKLAQMNSRPPASKPRPLGIVNEQEAFGLVMKYFVRLERDWQNIDLSDAEREETRYTLQIDAVALDGDGTVYQRQDGSGILERFLEGEGLKCPPSSPSFQRLAKLFRAAELEHTLRAIDLTEGRPVSGCWQDGRRGNREPNW